MLLRALIAFVFVLLDSDANAGGLAGCTLFRLTAAH